MILAAIISALLIPHALAKDAPDVQSAAPMIDIMAMHRVAIIDDIAPPVIEDVQHGAVMQHKPIIFRRSTDRLALLRRAERHIGTNPTGWARLWCARFLAMLAPHLARRLDNPNLARAWTRLPRAKTPAPGIIVVLSRGNNPRAGHIGVIKRVERRSLVVVSGNTIHRGKRAVGINRYPMHRVIALIDPDRQS